MTCCASTFDVVIVQEVTPTSNFTCINIRWGRGRVGPGGRRLKGPDLVTSRGLNGSFHGSELAITFSKGFNWITQGVT